MARRVRKPFKAQTNKGIRLSMPKIAAMAETQRDSLIARHGLEQALKVAKLVYQKVQATYNVQKKMGKI